MLRATAITARAAGGLGGVFARLARHMASYTPAGNFSSKRGNKNFYKGKGGKKYGKVVNGAHPPTRAGHARAIPPRAWDEHAWPYPARRTVAADLVHPLALSRSHRLSGAFSSFLPAPRCRSRPARVRARKWPPSLCGPATAQLKPYVGHGHGLIPWRSRPRE